MVICVRLGVRNLSIIQRSEVFVIQGVSNVYGEMVGTFRIVSYIVGVCC